MPSTGFYLFLHYFMSLVNFILSVSMPSTGFYLFLPEYLNAINSGKKVSMPSTGFYLFLQAEERRNNRTEDCVNALNGLLLISSPEAVKVCILSLICVNALNGLLLISSKKGAYYDRGTGKCQCPQRASTYFFLISPRKRERNLCVNALNGLLLISSLSIRKCSEKPSVCQCPQRASTYFFGRAVKERSSGKWCVNALNGLLLISSFEKNWGKFNFEISCQCPQRASTYFFLLEDPQEGDLEKVSMPSTGFYLFLQYPPRTLDFTEFWRGFLQVIN